LSRLFVKDVDVAFVHSINRELIQAVVGQEVSYYAISPERSRPDDLYDEAPQKVWDAPVRVNALVRYDNDRVETGVKGMDSGYPLEAYFHDKELEERGLVAREGDFIEFGEIFYEITSATKPDIIFGQVNNKVMTKCVCVPAREGQFAAGGDSSRGASNTHPVTTPVHDPK